jgi:spore coat protein CotF
MIIDNFMDKEEILLLNTYLNMKERLWKYGHTSGYYEIY